MARKPTFAVFASEEGPGDAERASIMSQAGGILARRGARLVCLAESDEVPTPLVTAARAAGGDVVVVAPSELGLPAALTGRAVERIDDPGERLGRIAGLSDVLIGLPGSLHSSTRLYQCWMKSGGQAGKPVVLLNRNRAFEVFRGFAADVISHSVKRHDRGLQFADTIEDVWNKANWLIGERQHAMR